MQDPRIARTACYANRVLRTNALIAKACLRLMGSLDGFLGLGSPRSYYTSAMCVVPFAVAGGAIAAMLVFYVVFEL